MRSMILDEPELEFGGAARHIDPRFGITNYGPADLGAADAPRAIRVGLIGPADQLDGLRHWLERCREPIAAKDERYPHLFPEFPGCDTDRGLHTTLVFSDRNTREISSRDLRAIEAASQSAALTKAVSIYAEEIRILADENRVDVLLVARPEQLIDTVSRSSRGLKKASDSSAQDALEEPPSARFANFHDLLKARLLHLRQPIQIIRRSTWDEATRPPEGHSRQDEASRAWNLHVALYYKAGGVPWRLLRNPADLTTCYVGVAFYRSDEGGSLSTSVAQVFNERGDGVIVRGGPARISRTDRQPHLARADAHALLVHALDSYRREHHTAPARIVLHKTSAFTDDEGGGFQDAADARFIDGLEMSWITSSEGVAAFRPGDAPPLRGTLIALDDRELALYATGSIEFYRTYPGMYIPRPIGIRPVSAVRNPREMATEVLALTKMNWNQTRLDGRLPVTLRTANQVKSVLRFCPPDQAVATRYAHYM
ncbi:argonaute/piwi family protein [Streptomyces sp. SD11]|uniref:argonaute/piwi family protein n=1 Tax=Streptomyces sp. SD11 TaxID=3452209 RepID=UPI003F89006F